MLLLSACATSKGATGQGGAAFNGAPARAPGIPAEELFELCWPEEATPQQSVLLITRAKGQVMFEAKGGATNSTARCIREIATSYPGPRPEGERKVSPPTRPPSGWAVLSYVGLLSPALFGPERGVLDPTPLVRACLSQHDSPRPGIRFIVSMDPELKVRLESSEGMTQPALTDSERCIEAVLGATVWPNTRRFKLDFSPKDTSGVAPNGSVGHYFAPPGSAVQGLDPLKVKEAISTRGPAVASCWEAALIRHAGLKGGRSVRLRVDESGTVSHVWVLGNVSAEPATAADFLFDGCLVAAVRPVRFPPGAAADAVYSWVFAERR